MGAGERGARHARDSAHRELGEEGGRIAMHAALLQLLKFSAALREDSGWVVPATVLWTARNAIQKVERPICQLILLNISAVPVPLVSGCFALVTCGGVLAIFRVIAVREDCHKKDS